MGGGQVHLAPFLPREGVQLLPDVLCKGLDQERVGGPPVYHRPGQAGGAPRTCSVQRAACSVQRAACSVQRAACSVQRAVYGKQYKRVQCAPDRMPEICSLRTVFPQWRWLPLLRDRWQSQQCPEQDSH